MIKEYWINVYCYPLSRDKQFIGGSYDHKPSAIHMATITGDCIYRIHVKMKEVKSKYNNIINHDRANKLNWMA